MHFKISKNLLKNFLRDICESGQAISELKIYLLQISLCDLEKKSFFNGWEKNWP